MNDKELSKFLALILRHKPETVGIELDKNGWAKVDELLNGMNKKVDIDFDKLKDIVKEDEKQRYSFNDDYSLIRANQGHSVNVDVELKESIPPDILWHGTGEKYVDSIDKTGLVSKSRLYVHLSPNIETAEKVGRRHGRPVIYEVKAKEMYNDGIIFYKSVNDVWLTKKVETKYLRKM